MKLAFVLPLCIFAGAMSAQTIHTDEGPDMLGTWKLNVAQSSFGSDVCPKADTAVITAYKDMYEIVQTVDYGGGLVTSRPIRWPGKGGEYTNQLEGGAIMRISAHLEGKRNVADVVVSQNGQLIKKEHVETLLSNDGLHTTRSIRSYSSDGTQQVARLVYDRL